MTFDFCPQCGNKLGKKEIGDEGLVPFCGLCNKVHFDFSYPCVLCLVIDENNNVVLTKNRSSGNYGGVAGYVKAGETIENAAKREVEEEVGLSAYQAAFVKSYYNINKDRLMLGFVCRVKNQNLRVSDELCLAEWFPLKEALAVLRQGSTIHELLSDYCLLYAKHVTYNK